MQRKNLFDGESYKAEFAIITYRWLMSRRWVTNADIMADRLGCSIEELPANLSNCDGYGELKKIVCIVKKAIRDKLGVHNKNVDDCFEEDGNNKNRRFRYIGKDNDPLAEMRNAKAITTFVNTGSSVKVLLVSFQNHGWSTSSRIAKICLT